jgi:hypothetical protein
MYTSYLRFERVPYVDGAAISGLLKSEVGDNGHGSNTRTSPAGFKDRSATGAPFRRAASNLCDPPDSRWAEMAAPQSSAQRGRIEPSGSTRAHSARAKRPSNPASSCKRACETLSTERFDPSQPRLSGAFSKPGPLPAPSNPFNYRAFNIRTKMGVVRLRQRRAFRRDEKWPKMGLQTDPHGSEEWPQRPAFCAIPAGDKRRKKNVPNRETGGADSNPKCACSAVPPPLGTQRSLRCRNESAHG